MSRRYPSRSRSRHRSRSISPERKLHNRGLRYSDRTSYKDSRYPSHSKHNRRQDRSAHRFVGTQQKRDVSKESCENSHENRHRVREKDSTQNRCITVFGLSSQTKQREIREIFSKFGPIDKIQVALDSKTGISRGFCFIYYKNIADARVAKDTCTGIEIGDRRIRVDYSKSEPYE